MENKWKTTCVIVIALVLINISFVSAGLLDVIKEQPTLKQDLISKDIQISESANKYPAVSIKTNLDLPLISKDIMDIILTQHDEVCGVDCSSQGYTKLYEDGILFTGFDFYTIEGDSRIKQDIRGYQVYIKTNEEEYIEDVYEYKCSPTGKISVNGTEEQTCSNIKTGTITKTKPLWERYNIGDVVSAGEYEWKLEGQKKSSRTVDFIPIVQGDNKITDWAEWGGVPYNYDNIDNSNIDTTLWNRGSLTENNGGGSGSGSTTWSEDTDKMTISSTTSSGGCPGDPSYSQTINAYNLPELINIESVNISVYLSATDNTASPTAGTSSVGIFGNFTIGVSSEDTPTSVTAYYNISAIRNKTYINNVFDIYINNVWNSRITAVNKNVSISTGAYSPCSSKTATGTAYIYWMNYSITNIILNSPTNNYISPSNSVDFNCSATVTVGATLTNMSLWTNSTGTWIRNTTQTKTGTTNNSIFTNSYSNGQSVLWTCQACDSDGDCGFASENRTVLIDTSAPTIVINSPTAIMNYGTLGGSETLNYTITDTNFASAWYNYNGTNVSLVGAINTTTFILDRSSGNNLTIYANDSVGNVNSLNRAWDYTIFENSKTYNTSTYETSAEPFTINVTGATSANLIYDGTSYAATGSGNVWSKSIDIPTITSPVNKTFYWSFISGASIINSSSYNQSVDYANFSKCGGAGGTTKFLNFTFKDEATGVSLNASNDDTSITYWLGSGSVTKSYNTLNTSLNYDYTFCATPNKTFYADVSFKYSNPTYPLRTFTYDNAALTNDTTFKTLYMLSSTSGIYSAIRTADVVGSSIPGVAIQYERQISGVWTLLGQEITGSDGVATLWLDPNYQYRLTATKVGFTATQVTIQPSQTTYTIVMSTGSGNQSYASDIPGITYFAFPGSGSLNPQANQQFNLTVMSTRSNLENCKLEIVNATNLSQALSSITGLTNSSYCFIQLYYTTTVDSNLFGRISVDTTESDGFVIIDTDYKWIMIDLNNTQSWNTITSFFSELKDIGEFGEGNEAEFSRFILFFLLLTIFIGVFTYFSGIELSTPGISLLILWIIIILASAGGFLSFEAGSDKISPIMRQYGFAFIFTELIIAQALSIGRRSKD